MSKKVSMQTIAERLGLSKYSVSQALSGKHGISEETRLKVIEMAKALGYRINNKITNDERPANNKKNADQNSTAPASTPFVFIWIHSSKLNEPSFWNRVLAGVINGCESLGWNHLMITNSGDEAEFVFPSYADRTLCLGVITIGSPSVSFVLSIKRMGLPVVLADHEEPLADLDCVVYSNFDAAKSMCRRMLALGCKSLVFIGSDEFAVSFRERWWGCRIAVEEESGADGSTSALVKWNVPYGGKMLPALEKRIAGLDRSSMPDCFICANDHIAAECMTLLKKYEVVIPEQCRVVGFDNSDHATYSVPALTTIELGKELLGFRSVEALQYRIANPGRPPEKIVLSYKLIARDSG